MSRVIRAGVTFVAAALFQACAPSVPRSPDAPVPSDAIADRASTIPEVDGGNNTREGGVKDNASSDLTTRDARGVTDVASDRSPDAPDGTDGARPHDAAPDATAGHADANAGDADASQGDADASHADAGADAGDGLAADDADGQRDAADDGFMARLPRPGDLRIDELLINPAGTDASREWIEVANVSGKALDLRMLHVADAAGEVAVDAGLLAPDALLVLGQSLDPTRNGGAPIAFSFGNTISLNNAAETITLCLGACASGVVLDQISWSTDLGPAFDGHAAIVGTPVDGGAPAFCPAQTPFGTAASFGTPAQTNPPCP